MVSLGEQIACVQRELALRRQVYPRRVSEHKMTSSAAERELARMTAVLETLLVIEARREITERLGTE